MSYTMYTPLNVWLDPASVTDVVAYIQNYLSNNPIYSTTEIEALINAYLIAHPELIGVQSVNGKTGTVVLSASDITTENDVTIESALASLSSQISSIAASVATNTTNITGLTGRMTTAETDISNLKSKIYKSVNASPLLFFIGGIKGADGDADNVANRLRTFKFLPSEIDRVYADENYMFSAFAWSDGDTYQGRINTNGEISSSGTIQTFTSLDLTALKKANPGYLWRLTMRRNDNQDITIGESTHLHFVTTNKELVCIPTIEVPDECSTVYGWYDAFVTAGLASKELLTTVNSLPMYAYTISALNKYATGNDNAVDTSETMHERRARILLYSGMHGDEKGAVVGLYQFVNSLCNDIDYQKYLAVFDFVVVPICNPTGFNLNTRNNYNDININRFDEAENEPECIALKTLIDADQYALFVDFHNCPGSRSAETVNEAIGAMSFSTTINENELTRYHNVYRSIFSGFANDIHSLFSKDITNDKQLLFPWIGADNLTARNYSYTHNVSLPFTKITGKFIRGTTGAVATSTTGVAVDCTNFIDIANYKKLVYKKINNTSTSATMGLAFYGTNDVTAFISGVVCSRGASEIGYTVDEIDVPINAKYVRFTMLQDTSMYGEFECYAVAGSDISACVETSNYCYGVGGSTHKGNGSSSICSIRHIKRVLERFIDYINDRFI